MKGLEISKLFCEKYLEPMLQDKFSSDLGMIATGLVGQGSECYGFDDAYSRDHDFGPGVCIWIPRRKADTIGAALMEAYEHLPKSIPECECSALSPERAGRIGVHTVEGFYESLIGLSSAPETNMEWLRIPDKYFSQACNGEVFFDPLGEFTEIREKLLSFYPNDVFKKKLAANCAGMAQSGQYNYGRCASRKDFGAAYLACAEFVKHTLAVLYLLNGKYMPFYKWAFRGTVGFECLGSCVGQLKALASASDLLQSRLKQEQIEEICVLIGKELSRRGLSDNSDDFMQYHAQKITASIEDAQLRSLPIMYGGI